MPYQDFPESAIGRLLVEISWQRAKWYRKGGQGFENVLTAEVFERLDFLPREAFLGEVLRRAHGAVEAIEVLRNEVESLRFTLLPGNLLIVGSEPKGNSVWVQPDGRLEAPGGDAYCLIEAKRIKPGNFGRKQLAREYVAVRKFARGRAPVLLLVLPEPPPVPVKKSGKLSFELAIREPLRELMPEIGDALGTHEDLMGKIDATLAYVTWSEIAEAVTGARKNFPAPDSSVNAAVCRIADSLLAAIDWNGRHPRLPLPIGTPGAGPA